jgi:hypothetical protein
MARIGRASSWRYNEGRITRPETTYVTNEQKPEELIDIFTKRMHDIGIKRSCPADVNARNRE